MAGVLDGGALRAVGAVGAVRAAGVGHALEPVKHCGGEPRLEPLTHWFS